MIRSMMYNHFILGWLVLWKMWCTSWILQCNGVYCVFFIILKSENQYDMCIESLFLREKNTMFICYTFNITYWYLTLIKLLINSFTLMNSHSCGGLANDIIYFILSAFLFKNKTSSLEKLISMCGNDVKKLENLLQILNKTVSPKHYLIMQVYIHLSFYLPRCLPIFISSYIYLYP